MLQLPLFKSMRWPFREFVQFQFFLHLFLVVRPPGLNANARIASAVFGTFVYVVPLVTFPFAPTFNSMTWDRELLFSGGTERYWAQVRPMLKPTDRVAVLIPLDVYMQDRFEEPYSLLGTYNYAALGGFVNAWGYSPTVPRDQVYTSTYAFYPFGAYHPDQKAALLAEKPDLKFITLESPAPAADHAELARGAGDRPDAVRAGTQIEGSAAQAGDCREAFVAAAVRPWTPPRKGHALTSAATRLPHCVCRGDLLVK